VREIPKELVNLKVLFCHFCPNLIKIPDHIRDKTINTFDIETDFFKILDGKIFIDYEYIFTYLRNIVLLKQNIKDQNIELLIKQDNYSFEEIFQHELKKIGMNDFDKKRDQVIEQLKRIKGQQLGIIKTFIEKIDEVDIQDGEAMETLSKDFELLLKVIQIIKKEFKEPDQQIGMVLHNYINN
jgi:hypothetical protein